MCKYISLVHNSNYLTTNFTIIINSRVVSCHEYAIDNYDSTVLTWEAMKYAMRFSTKPHQIVPNIYPVTFCILLIMQML